MGGHRQRAALLAPHAAPHRRPTPRRGARRWPRAGRRRGRRRPPSDVSSTSARVAAERQDVGEAQRVALAPPPRKSISVAVDGSKTGPLDLHLEPQEALAQLDRARRGGGGSAARRRPSRRRRPRRPGRPAPRCARRRRRAARATSRTRSPRRSSTFGAASRRASAGVVEAVGRQVQVRMRAPSGARRGAAVPADQPPGRPAVGGQGRERHDRLGRPEAPRPVVVERRATVDEHDLLADPRVQQGARQAQPGAPGTEDQVHAAPCLTPSRLRPAGAARARRAGEIAATRVTSSRPKPTLAVRSMTANTAISAVEADRPGALGAEQPQHRVDEPQHGQHRQQRPVQRRRRAVRCALAILRTGP